MWLVCGIILELACHSATDYGQRFGSNFLGKAEEFIKSQSIALIVIRILTLGECIVPAVHVYRAVLNRTYAVLPLVALFKGGALHYAASGKAQYAGLELSQCCGYVGTQTVLVIVVSVNGEQ